MIVLLRSAFSYSRCEMSSQTYVYDSVVRLVPNVLMRNVNVEGGEIGGVSTHTIISYT